MMRILVTTEFCNNAKKLVDEKDPTAIHNLRTILILLANNKPIPKKWHDHQLTDSDFRELHITGDTLLLYRYDTDSDTLTVSLKLANVTDHKKLDKQSHRKNFEYYEVSTTDLHDITSATEIDPLDEEIITDIVESISDYASMNTANGYVLLSDFFIDKQDLHCYYDYYLYDTNAVAESIDYVINLDRFNVLSYHDLVQYVKIFAQEVSNAFERN